MGRKGITARDESVSTVDWLTNLIRSVNELSHTIPDLRFKYSISEKEEVEGYKYLEDVAEDLQRLRDFHLREANGVHLCGFTYVQREERLNPLTSVSGYTYASRTQGAMTQQIAETFKMDLGERTSLEAFQAASQLSDEAMAKLAIGCLMGGTNLERETAFLNAASLTRNMKTLGITNLFRN